jgi:ubiquinone/menaquinone biosynthesis C-methylase UbiE
MYADFALVYDRLMAEVDYDAWARHYAALLEQNGVSQGARVLEAACGTGNLTVRLAKTFQVQPSDLSQEMLSVAAGKAKAQGLSLAFVRQDMQSLASHRPQDAVIAGCDGVNYLLTDRELKRFLSSAYMVLKPGGVLAFDLSSEDKLRRVLGSQPQVLREDDICYIWDNAWQEDTRRLHLSLSIFEKLPTGAYRRIDEDQVQKAWTREQITRALEEAGFEGVACYGNFGFVAPEENAQRLFFTARKPIK